jgi:hypothetical protein
LGAVRQPGFMRAISGGINILIPPRSRHTFFMFRFNALTVIRLDEGMG